MRALIVGGFEESGHDSLTEAVAEAGRSRGHTVLEWAWRVRVPGLDDHPLFHLHRDGVRRNAPQIARILDSAAIPRALAFDLRGILDSANADVVISTHPWSTTICASLLSSDDTTLLVDCHGEFAPFPLVEHQRVNAYVGGAFTASIRPAVRERVWPTGVPCRFQFAALAGPTRLGPRSLAVNAGHGAWGVAQAAAAVLRLTTTLQVERMFLFARAADEQAAWRDALQGNGVEVAFVGTTDEIAAALLSSEWFVTKASGAAVAEGLAASCIICALESGVFWEDEARAYLSAARAVIPITANDDPEVIVEAAHLVDGAGALRAKCLAAGNEIWAIIENRCVPARSSADDVPFALEVLSRLDALGSTRIPETTTVLREELNAWLSP